MSDSSPPDSLSAGISGALVSVPQALIPASVKALDRLIGSAVDIPIAWLAQKKAKIDAQTEAFKLVEASIAKAAAGQAGADQATIERAVDVLVRKAYRKQTNREAVANAMIEDLRAEPEQTGAAGVPPREAALDDDWLNVFERYAEDASTERMQRLWGRVLAGEVRKPGRYSTRTLRLLSEFSQADGLTFAAFCDNAFVDTAPLQLVKPDGKKDIRDLIYLESSGLILASGGSGFSASSTFDNLGNVILAEGRIAILLKGVPNTSFSYTVAAFTPLGQELMTLLPSRDLRAAARKVANAIRSPAIKSAYLATIQDGTNRVLPMEVLWQDEIAVESVPGG